MSTGINRIKIYDGEGDDLIQRFEHSDHIVLLPDERDLKRPSDQHGIRIMWGQAMLDDLLAGRYRTLVCAVNANDNSRGIITELARSLPTSQWDEPTITSRARQFSESAGTGVKVIKYDLDAVEVLALLRPAHQAQLSINDLSVGFKIVSEMISRRTERLPSASVSFLGARSNALRDHQDNEPTFETVLRTMHDAGYVGDVYPAPTMWASAPTAVYARYPFPPSVQHMRDGGF